MRTRATIFGLWAFAFLLSYFFRSANAVIAGDLRAEFGLDASQLGLMTATFLAALALAQLPLGSALDRWGPRAVVPALMVAALVGSIVFASAQDLTTLTVGRTLLGLGFAGVLMGALQTFGAWFPARRFATASSALVALGTSGALLAGTPLAWLAAAAGWRTVYLIGAGAVGVAVLALVLGSRDRPHGEAGGRRGVTPTAAGRAMDRLGTMPGSYLTILGDPRFWGVALLNLFAVGTLLAMQGLWAGTYLADVHALPALRVGDLLAVLATGVVLGNVVNGVWADRAGPARVALGSGSVFLACQLALLVAPAGTPTVALAALYVIYGASGSFGVVLFAHARTLYPPQLTGRAITAVNLFGIGGAMALQWAMGALIEAGRSADGSYAAAAYRPAFVLTAAVGAIALVAYRSLARDGARPPQPPFQEGRSSP